MVPTTIAAKAMVQLCPPEKRSNLEPSEPSRLQIEGGDGQNPDPLPRTLQQATFEVFRPPRRVGRTPMKAFAFFTAAGAALAYFFDPDNGKRRRHIAVDRAAALLRRFGRKAERAGRQAASAVHGAGMKVAHAKEEPKAQPNDAALVQKVQSEVFRDPAIPKGQINVNAENGVVYLRGRVDSPDLMAQFERAVRDVQGVRDVENLMHLGPQPSSSQEA
jgi:hypothetical protein